jgi:hypothetical protein
MTYDYNASAIGLGGVLKNADGTTTVIPSLASVHLAPTGGRGTAEISDYNKYGVSFTTACSTVLGSDSGQRTFTTSSDIYMTNLNLFGRIQVDLLQTSITSTRNVFAEESMTMQSNADNARFTMHSMIRGLVIDGVEVIPEFDFALTECPTYQEFTNRISGDGVPTYAKQFGVEPTELQSVLTANVQPIRASFVSALHHTPTDKIGPRKGFKLPVKNLGYVHFGELVVKPGRRRVNLLRIEFDSTLAFWDENIEEGFESPSSSPIGGSMTVLSQANNGAPSWP